MQAGTALTDYSRGQEHFVSEATKASKGLHCELGRRGLIWSTLYSGAASASDWFHPAKEHFKKSFLQVNKSVAR